jgi:hypothetical protein
MNFRTLALVVIFAGLSSAAVAETTVLDIAPAQSTDGSQPSVDLWSQILKARNSAVLYSAACCKVCSKGKACGDSCISRSYTCRKGTGCACDG